MSLTSTIATIAAGLALVGGVAAMTPPASSLPPRPVATTAPAEKPADDATKALLNAAYEEERLARDLYTLFSDSYDGARPFSTILRSEQQHMNSVAALMRLYGVAVPPADKAPGSYDGALQALYDEWRIEGLASIEGARQVGVDLETRDIADLEQLAARTTEADIRATLERLLAGSRNHLRAFEAAVAGTAPTTPAGPVGAGDRGTPGTQGAGTGRPRNGAAVSGQRQGAGVGTADPRVDADGDGICDVTGLPMGTGSQQTQNAGTGGYRLGQGSTDQ